MFDFEVCTEHCPDIFKFSEISVALTSTNVHIRSLAQLGMEWLEEVPHETGPRPLYAGNLEPETTPTGYACTHPHAYKVDKIASLINDIKEGEKANAGTSVF